MKTDKLTIFFNEETKEFNDFVESADDIQVDVLEVKGVAATVQIRLCNEDAEIKVTGEGPDVITAFYVAKNNMIELLIELQEKAIGEVQEDFLPSKAKNQRSLH